MGFRRDDTDILLHERKMNMAYNPAFYFPQSYQPMYQPMQQQPAPQGRMVEIVPVDTVEAAETFPVLVGATQMMIAKDDSFIAVKTNGVNGQSTFSVYDKRPPAPPAPVFTPDEYVRKDELEKLIAALLEPKNKGAEK